MEIIFRRLSQFGEFSFDTLRNVVDVLLVSYVVYRVLSLVRGSRAWRILGGIVIFVIALYVSDVLQLRTLHWLLDKATLLAPVALVILLLPELRQALEGFSRLGLWPDRFAAPGNRPGAQTIEEIVAALAEMSSQNIGALIVIERDNQLNEIVANGVSLDAQVTAPLIGSIFFENNPLHDGAVIIRGDKILSAACRLPLSENTELDSHVHMRHRAGVGVSEQSDCVALIVSEERGTISVSIDGKLVRVANATALRDLLNQEVRIGKESARSRRKKSKELTEVVS